VLKCLEPHEERTAALKQEMAERIERLESVPGVGPVIVFAFSAFVNGERFENGAQVGNYLGLTPQVYIVFLLVKN
jgi:transposase